MFVLPPIHQRVAGFRLLPIGRDRRGARRPSERTRARFRIEPLEERYLLSITEFPVPGGYPGPVGIVTGPDGNLWFTQGSELIGEINPTTHASTEFAVPTPFAYPNGITACPDGNLWFTEKDANQIGEINPTTHVITEFPIPTAGSAPYGITAGADGNLWFAQGLADSAGLIGMINPTTHVITEFPLPSGSGGPRYIAAGPDGNLWFTELASNQIGMINPTTDAISEFSIPTAAAEPWGITAGPDGNLWFTEDSGNQIGEINPTTHVISEFPVPTTFSLLEGITAGPDGNLWFCETHAGQIGIINPTTHASTEYTVPGGSTPQGITTGPDGNIWFTDGNTVAIGVDTLNTTHFVVTQQPPTSVTAGSPFGLTVEDEDNSGNLDSSFDGTVTVALANDLGGATLGGTLTATALGGVATFAGLTLDTANAGYTLQFSASGVYTATKSAITVTPAAASQLVIIKQPAAAATAGQAFGTQPVIEVEDQYDNVETGDNITVVTASLASGTGMLQGTDTVIVLGGVAAFTNLADDKAETIALDFTSGSLTEATSNDIVVSPAPASKLVIQTHPSATATAGQAFGAQPVIDEEDQYGNLETADNSTVVTATLHTGTGPLHGTTSVTLSGGVAKFTNLADNKAETIALKFTSGTLTEATTNDIVVSPASASKLVIQTQPSSTAIAGQAFATQPVIDEEDQYGNLETGDNSTVVTATLASSAGPLQGTTTVTLSGGVATFTNLADDKAETIALEFNGGGLTSVPSSGITVSPAAASKVVFGQQPASAALGAAITPAVTVKVEDAFNNVVSGDGSTVTLTLSSGTFAGVSSSAATAASSGVATFNNLKIDVPGSYTLSAADGALTPTGASDSFTISPATATQLVIHTQPSPTATAGQAFGTQVVVYAEDQFGNLETGDNSTEVTASIAGGSGPLQGTTSVTVSGGVATFTNLADNKAETISLNFTSGSLTNATSTNIVVSPATASQLVIHTQPSSTATAGVPFGAQPVVYEEDQFGNLETKDNSTVVTATLHRGTGPLDGTTAVTVSGGVATFTNLADNRAEAFSLSFISGSLSSVPTSSTVLTAPAPTVRLEQVVTARKTNKKGKSVGKPLLVGFVLDYSTAMDPSTASLAANYQVDRAVIKRVKEARITVLRPVNITSAYNQSSDSVTLTVKGKPKFATGGQIKIIASSPNGVSSEAGVPLDANDAVFTILAKAKGITPG